MKMCPVVSSELSLVKIKGYSSQRPKSNTPFWNNPPHGKDTYESTGYKGSI